jgi:4-hydroxy-2-oxoheptanedioate aldolase
VQYGGADYWQGANDEIILLAMIETRKGVQNLDSILSVKGLDGVYVGPSDLSLSLGKPPTLDPSDKEVLDAMATICKGVRSRGLIAGVHTDGVKTALRRFEEGYQLCTILNDARLMANAAAQAVKEIKGQAPPAAPKTY